ncbi:MAG TPA: dienelactone hydrolase family protein, partial [Usitatibacter sp.]|nr:dienelactone hydrolase family protein [Usitatibacter sp.]
MKTMAWAVVSAAIAACALPVAAKIVTQTVAYEHKGQKMQGYLAYDDARSGPRPGVLVVHEWWG